MKLLLVDIRVAEYPVFVDARKPDVDYLIYNFRDETHASLAQKIVEKSAEVGQNFTDIALLQHGRFNSGGIQIVDEAPVVMTEPAPYPSTDKLVGFLTELKNGCGLQRFDFLACSVYDPATSKAVFDYMEAMTGVDIRASTNFTGNAPDGDWILESDNVDVRENYFTDAILSWTGVLGPAYTYMRFITTYLQGAGALTQLGELFVFGRASGQSSDVVYPSRRSVSGDIIFTSNTDNSFVINDQSYGNGTYRITTSTTGYPAVGAVPWKIFNNSTASDPNVWYSFEGNVYTNTSGGSAATTNAALTTVGGAGVRGEWIQVQFPTPIDFGRVVFWYKSDNGFDQRIPVGMVFAVSNDGTTWSNYYTANFNDGTRIVNTLIGSRYEATVFFSTARATYISRIANAVISPVPIGAAVPNQVPRFFGFGGGFMRGRSLPVL